MYRFQYLTDFNQRKITEKDRKVAKMNFHIFDRLLSMDIVSMPVTNPPENNKNNSNEKQDPVNPEQEKNELKMRTKKNSECAKTTVDRLLFQ